MFTLKRCIFAFIQPKNMKYLLFVFTLFTLLVGCSKINTSISALGEQDNHGGYVVKWEIYPEINESLEQDSILEIYASKNDIVFPSTPIKRVNVNKYIAVIEKADSLGYSFFKLKFGDTYSDVFSNRFFELNEIVNFRDIGGYKTTDNREVRWRKIFRSGDLANATEKDKQDINKLNIKTIVDFRSKESQVLRKDIIETPNRYELYAATMASDSVKKEVLLNRFLRGDAIIFMQDTYEDVLLNRTEEYRNFFDILTNEDNYPVLIHCSLGKDQSAIAAYFLLRALGVASEIAEDDYMLSNIGIDKSKIVVGAEGMTELQQEAFTMLTKTDISYLKYGLACIRKNEGSIDDYMTNQLGLTKEKREKLKDILLY